MLSMREIINTVTDAEINTEEMEPTEERIEDRLFNDAGARIKP